jgi:hypothetical protein
VKLSRKLPKRKIPKVKELTNCSFDELAGRANDPVLDCDCNRQSERLTTITTSRNYKINRTPPMQSGGTEMRNATNEWVAARAKRCERQTKRETEVLGQRRKRGKAVWSEGG